MHQPRHAWPKAREGAQNATPVVLAVVARRMHIGQAAAITIVTIAAAKPQVKERPVARRNSETTDDSFDIALRVAAARTSVARAHHVFNMSFPSHSLAVRCVFGVCWHVRYRANLLVAFLFIGVPRGRQGKCLETQI